MRSQVTRVVVKGDGLGASRKGTVYRLPLLGESFADGPLAELARWAAEHRSTSPIRLFRTPNPPLAGRWTPVLSLSVRLLDVPFGELDFEVGDAAVSASPRRRHRNRRKP
jgi:hypothetical protein